MTIRILSPPIRVIQLQFFIARCSAAVNFICSLQCPLKRYAHFKFWVALTHAHCAELCALYSSTATTTANACTRSMPWITDRKRPVHGCGLVVECGCNGRSDGGKCQGNRRRERKGMGVLHITSISSQ